MKILVNRKPYSVSVYSALDIGPHVIATPVTSPTIEDTVWKGASHSYRTNGGWEPDVNRLMRVCDKTIRSE